MNLSPTIRARNLIYLLEGGGVENEILGMLSSALLVRVTECKSPWSYPYSEIVIKKNVSESDHLICSPSVAVKRTGDQHPRFLTLQVSCNTFLPVRGKVVILHTLIWKEVILNSMRLASKWMCKGGLYCTVGFSPFPSVLLCPGSSHWSSLKLQTSQQISAPTACSQCSLCYHCQGMRRGQMLPWGPWITMWLMLKALPRKKQRWRDGISQRNMEITLAS